MSIFFTLNLKHDPQAKAQIYISVNTLRSQLPIHDIDKIFYKNTSVLYRPIMKGSSVMFLEAKAMAYRNTKMIKYTYALRTENT